MLPKVAGRALSSSSFFSALPEATAGRLPPKRRDFATRRGPGPLLKIDYGRPEIHYEAWHHSRSGRLEVGLHSEGPSDLNGDLLAFLAPRLLEIKATLYRAELEPWDKGWCRLYETLPAPTFSDRMVDATAALLAAYITTLQPLVEEYLDFSRTAARRPPRSKPRRSPRTPSSRSAPTP